MSYRIEKTLDRQRNIFEWNIYLTRGDYFAARVDMTNKNTGESISPTNGSLRFAVKKKYRDGDEKLLILKQIPLSTRLLELEGDDTKKLSFGDYDYDIEYTDDQGHPDTFIEGKLYLTKEVF